VISIDEQVAIFTGVKERAHYLSGKDRKGYQTEMGFQLISVNKGER